MNLHRLLQQRADAGRPVRVGLIGAGKFGSMFLSQVPTVPGLEIAVIADLDPERARAACHQVGWDAARIARTRFASSGIEACGDADIEVVVEATGIPAAGIAHAQAAIAAGKHMVMVNVEADVLAGPLLAEEARAKGVVYSMAYGDQPALTCELVDWARACGFEVVAAGKGTKYLPAYHAVTPDDVWAHYGLSPEEARAGGMTHRCSIRFSTAPNRRSRWRRSRTRPASPCRRTGSAFRPAASMICRMSCAGARMAASCRMTAWSRSSRLWSATAARYSAICAGASMSC